MAASNTYFYALGRRKSATARVRLTSGKGNITINGKPAAEYFADSKALLERLVQPFKALELEGKHDVTVVVNGGGHKGQIEAISLGIAKAIVVMTPDLKSTLKR